MNIKLIIILVFICLAASCGKAKKQSIDEGKSNDAMQEHILGSWSVKSDTNMVLRNLDTLLITSSDKKLNIKLRRNKTITFDSVTFLKTRCNIILRKTIPLDIMSSSYQMIILNLQVVLQKDGMEGRKKLN